MKKLAVIIGACLISNAAIAENKGIEDTNYSVSTSASDSDSGNRMSISGKVRLPIADYTGATIIGRYSDFNGNNNYIDSLTNSASLGVFFRKYDLGIINATYGYSQTEADTTITSSKKSIKSISLNGIYYYKEFDVGLGRSKANPDSGNSLNTSTASISYYVNENLKVGASVIRMDQDDMNFFISYQPETFGNNIGFAASYVDSETNDTATVSVTYYFGTRVSVKDRGRRY